eukprot:Gb_32179 [translate_table: standard]
MTDLEPVHLQAVHLDIEGQVAAAVLHRLASAVDVDVLYVVAVALSYVPSKHCCGDLMLQCCSSHSPDPHLQHQQKLLQAAVAL